MVWTLVETAVLDKTLVRWLLKRSPALLERGTRPMMVSLQTMISATTLKMTMMTTLKVRAITKITIYSNTQKPKTPRLITTVARPRTLRRKRLTLSCQKIRPIKMTIKPAAPKTQRSQSLRLKANWITSTTMRSRKVWSKRIKKRWFLISSTLYTRTTPNWDRCSETKLSLYRWKRSTKSCKPICREVESKA